MPEITAAAVKALRDKTQLPMMQCKKALTDAGGDQEEAIRLLREGGAKVVKRADRTTDAGRLAISVSLDPGVGAMVELKCESSPVANMDEFRNLAQDLAAQLANGPSASDPDELLSQPSPSADGKTLGGQLEEYAGRVREVIRLERLLRIDAPCGGYVHHTGTDGVLLQASGGTPQLAKEISMHIAAMRPAVVKIEDLDPAEVEKERQILTEQARSEGKPDKIIEKMVEGRLRNFYAERVLTEQPFVKDEKSTVGQLAKANGIELVGFTHWRLGQSG